MQINHDLQTKTSDLINKLEYDRKIIKLLQVNSYKDFSDTGNITRFSGYEVEENENVPLGQVRAILNRNPLTFMQSDGKEFGFATGGIVTGGQGNVTNNSDLLSVYQNFINFSMGAHVREREINHNTSFVYALNISE